MKICSEDTNWVVCVHLLFTIYFLFKILDQQKHCTDYVALSYFLRSGLDFNQFWIKILVQVSICKRKVCVLAVTVKPKTAYFPNHFLVIHRNDIFTARKRSLRRLCFYRCLSVHTGGGAMRGFIWGAWVVLFGGRGHAWFYLGACMVLFGGVCMVLFGGVHGFIRGCAWYYLGEGAWFYSGGMHGFILGACVVLFGGHAWFYSGGVHGFSRGRAWFFQGGMCGFSGGGHAWFFQVFFDTMRYGQWAGGTHPTGMHSCFALGVDLPFMNTISVDSLVFTNNRLYSNAHNKP